MCFTTQTMPSIKALWLQMYELWCDSRWLYLYMLTLHHCVLDASGGVHKLKVVYITWTITHHHDCKIYKEFNDMNHSFRAHDTLTQPWRFAGLGLSYCGAAQTGRSGGPLANGNTGHTDNCCGCIANQCMYYVIIDAGNLRCDAHSQSYVEYSDPGTH